MITDSKNILTDFDMSLALVEKSINSQLQYAWLAWKKRKAIPDPIRIFKRMKDGKLVDSKYGITASLAPMTISLNVGSGKFGQVEVSLRLNSGSVRYNDEDEGDKDYPISDWTISFLTDLDKKPAVDVNALKEVDPDSFKSAQDVLKRTGLPDSVFSIEYLFLKFTEVDLMLVDNKNVSIPSKVPAGARERALSCLNLLLQGDLGDFIFGIVMRRNRKQSTPTFALTDFVFDVHAGSTPDVSTLSYLGEFSGRQLPSDANAARIKLTDDWVRREMIDGTSGLVSGVLAIRKEIFLDGYLVPELQKSLGVAPRATGLKRVFSRNDSQSLTQDGAVPLTEDAIDSSRGYTLQIEPTLGSNVLSISGSVNSSFSYHERSKSVGPIPSEEIGSIEAAGRRSLTGSVSLVAKGIGADFSVQPNLEYQFGDFEKTQDDQEGTGILENAFSAIPKLLGLTKGTLQEMLNQYAQSQTDALKTALEKTLAHIKIDLSHHQFIPPGGGTFTFQNLRFSGQTGDLMLDVIYQAPK